MTWPVRLVGAGLVLAALLAAIAGAARGSGAALASSCGSLPAVLAQFVAVALLRPVMGERTPVFLGRWVAGMAVRGASLVAVAVLLVLLRGTLPVLWMAIGYLGVLLPLLFVETRYLR